MDIFQTMRLFIAVAQSGSFTAAAKLLDTNTGNADFLDAFDWFLLAESV